MSPQYTQTRLLILTKTYPNPSSKYRETTCVAALDENGELRRLYPVPFRFLDGDRQFQKWKWVSARVALPNDDKRPESRRMDVDSIVRLEKVDTKNAWRERMGLVSAHVASDFHDLCEAQKTEGRSLGIVRVHRLLGLEIVPVRLPDWTERELARLEQDGLFDSGAARNRPTLRKLPYRFYYEYELDGANGVSRHRHMITDWEVGALYWRCVRQYKDEWESKLRIRLEQEFRKKDLHLLMGTYHRFPDQWLIIGLIYPPRVPGGPSQATQLGLPLG